jgi:hypothetical protein
MDSSSRKVGVILQIWIILATVALVIGIVLVVSRISTAATDSSAAVIATSKIELLLKPRATVPQQAQNRYNKGELLDFDIKMTLPTNNQYRTMVLRVQYDKRYIEPVTSGMWTFGTRYLDPIPGTCVAISTNHTCAEVTLSLLGNNYFQPTETVGTLKLKVKEITPVSLTNVSGIVNDIVAIHPVTAPTTSTAIASHGTQWTYLGSPNDATSFDWFADGSKANVDIIGEDWCLGDYNRIAGRAGVSADAQVDLQDLSTFASKFKTALTQDQIWYDIVRLTGETAPQLTTNDLSAFVTNYAKPLAQCVNKRSTLPY